MSATLNKVIERFISPLVPTKDQPFPLRRVRRALKASSLRVSPPETVFRPIANPNVACMRPLADLYSYDTRIARLMFNQHSNKPELWVTPTRYSSTTDRHSWAVRRAFYLAMTDNTCESDPDPFRPWLVPQTTAALQQVYYTKAAHATPTILDGRDEAMLRSYDHELSRSTHQLRMATKPRLFESTRKMHIQRAHELAREMKHHIQNDLPEPPALPLLDSHIAFIETLLDENMPMDAKRAMIAGFVALEFDNA